MFNAILKMILNMIAGTILSFFYIWVFEYSNIRPAAKDLLLGCIGLLSWYGIKYMFSQKDENY